MSIQHSVWAWEQKLPPLEKLVLLVLANSAAHDGDTRFSSRRLADEVGCSAQTAKRALRKLHSLGMIAVLSADERCVQYRVGPEGGAQ